MKKYRQTNKILLFIILSNNKSLAGNVYCEMVLQHSGINDVNITSH